MAHNMSHVKRNPATGDVAIRTMFNEELFPDLVWLVATTGSGAKNADNAYVEGWDDLYTPPEEG